MPEQLTKHPDVTLQVLGSGAAVCGPQGGAPQILTRCPSERFCKLPGGELCVYGLADAAQMTQLSAADWRALAQTVAPAPAAAPASAASPPAPTGGGGALLHGSAGLLVGLAIGAALAAAWLRRSAVRGSR